MSDLPQLIPNNVLRSGFITGINAQLTYWCTKLRMTQFNMLHALLFPKAKLISRLIAITSLKSVHDLHDDHPDAKALDSEQLHKSITARENYQSHTQAPYLEGL